MKLQVEQELLSLCKEIVEANRSASQWRRFESDDMFHNEHFCGGFDAGEDAFCFSYYNPSGTEFWFQLTLSEVRQVVSGELNLVDARYAEV